MDKLTNCINYHQNELSVIKLLFLKNFSKYSAIVILLLIILAAEVITALSYPFHKNFYLIIVCMVTLAAIERIQPILKKRVAKSYKDIPTDIKKKDFNLANLQCYFFKQYLIENNLYKADALLFIKEHILLKKKEFSIPNIGIGAIITGSAIFYLKKITDNANTIETLFICIGFIILSFVIAQFFKDIKSSGQEKNIQIINNIDSLLFELNYSNKG